MWSNFEYIRKEVGVNKTNISFLRKKSFLKGMDENMINNLVISSMFQNIELNEGNLPVLENVITDGKKDKSVDLAIVVKEYGNTDTAYLIQHTTNSVGISAKILSSIKEMRMVVNNYEKYYKKEQLNEKVYNAIKKIKESKNNINFKYVFIADFDVKKIDDSYTEEFDNKDDMVFIDGNDFNYHFLTKFIKGIRVDDVYDKTPTMWIRKKDLDINGLKKKGKKSFFGTISAGSLIFNFNKFGKDLFGDNVRYYLGQGNKVNKGIIKTLENNEERERFTSFNNGITIVCSSIKPPADNKDEYSIWDAQIINGAQTTTTLSKVDVKLLEGIQVPVKIIIEKDKENILKIAKFSNSQTSINQRDLFSNSKEQIELQKYFLENKVFLNIKKNEFQTEDEEFFEYSSNTDVAQAFLSTFLKDPKGSKNHKSKIFIDEDTGYYKEIFLFSEKEKLFISYLIQQKVTEARIYSKNSTNKYFVFSMNYIIFKRIKDLLEQLNVKNVISALKNITKDKIAETMVNMAEYLLINDKNNKGEEKTFRELSISSNLKTNLDEFYESISWKNI